MGEVITFPRRTTVVEPRPLLWREAVGHELRRERIAQDRTQGEIAGAAGISTQYLSEIERGRKEPSSEILEATAGALGLGLADLARRVADAADDSAADRGTADAVDLVSAPAGPPDAAPRPDAPVLLAA